MKILYLVERKPYSFIKFLWDCTLVVFTGGLWLIWIFVREMRNYG